MAEKHGIPRQNSDLALSEVVGFILLLGVIVAAFALWMTYIVPIEGREAEITQMNDVKDRFTDYKISLDSLWINSPSGAAWDQSGVRLSTSFNLGTGGGNSQASGLFLPLLNPLASPAVLAVNDTGDFMTITSGGPEGTVPPPGTTYNMGSLEYRTQNYYWIQQTYYYQNGGVFLSQENGSTCRVSPPISFVDRGSYRLVTITPITLYGDRVSMGGNGPVRVDTRMRALNQTRVVDVQNSWVNVSVTVSDYNTAKMWLEVFNTTRREGEIFTISPTEFGISPPGSKPATAFMNITGPQADMTRDVYLKIRPTEYEVNINSIASDYS